MISAEARAFFKERKLRERAERATFRNIKSGLFEIKETAQASIKKSKEPSKEGEPPTTRGKRGHNLRGAIFVSADKESGITGPRGSWVGTAGEAHEFGRTFKGDRFDERPFMEPALESNLDRIADMWKGSIGA